MRLRITQQLRGNVDGIQLSSFQEGYVYDVGTNVANYLLASSAAEPVGDDVPHIILPPDKQLFHPGLVAKNTARLSKATSLTHQPLAEAADRAPRQRRTNRAEKQTHAIDARSAVSARVEALAVEIDRIKRELNDLDQG